MVKEANLNRKGETWFQTLWNTSGWGTGEEVNMKLFELKVLQLVSQKLLMRCPGVSWHEGQGGDLKKNASITKGE